MGKQFKPKSKFHERMLELGYNDIADFIQSTKCSPSPETIRRLMYENKDVTPPTLVLIMRSLKYTPAEIRKELIARGDKVFHHIIADAVLDDLETALLDAARAVAKEDPEVFSLLGHSLELIARGRGVDIADAVAKLKGVKDGGL